MLSSTTYQSQWKETTLPCLVILIVITFAPCREAYAPVTNEELRKETPTREDEIRTDSKPMGLVFGLRAGAALPTEKVLKNTGNGTSIGPLVNGEVLYALREWVRVGMMLEWHQHSINLWGRNWVRWASFQSCRRWNSVQTAARENVSDGNRS